MNAFRPSWRLPVVVAAALLMVPVGAPGASTATAAPASVAVSTPATTVKAPATRARASLRVSSGQRLTIDVNPNLTGKGAWRVKVERRKGGTWHRVCNCRTKGAI